MKKLLNKIDEQLALCEKATRGPWFTGRLVDDGDFEIFNGEPSLQTGPATLWQRANRIENAVFIADSRTGYPSALKALKLAVTTLQQVQVDALKGDETCTELNCHHLSEHALADIDSIMNQDESLMAAEGDVPNGTGEEMKPINKMSDIELGAEALKKALKMHEDHFNEREQAAYTTLEAAKEVGNTLLNRIAKLEEALRGCILFAECVIGKESKEINWTKLNEARAALVAGAPEGEK